MARTLSAGALVLIGMLALLVTGCALSEGPRAGGPAARPGMGTRAPATPAPRVTAGTQTGKASWYGDIHHGKTTTSGETYDMTKLTAAHRTLPLGTRVRVTNLTNGRSVVVRINDRGPFVGGRIIDLSRAAASALAPLGAGVFTVRVEVLADAAAE